MFRGGEVPGEKRTHPLWNHVDMGSQWTTGGEGGRRGVQEEKREGKGETRVMIQPTVWGWRAEMVE